MPTVKRTGAVVLLQVQITELETVEGVEEDEGERRRPLQIMLLSSLQMNTIEHRTRKVWRLQVGTAKLWTTCRIIGIR